MWKQAITKHLKLSSSRHLWSNVWKSCVSILRLSKFMAPGFNFSFTLSSFGKLQMNVLIKCRKIDALLNSSQLIFSEIPFCYLFPVLVVMLEWWLIEIRGTALLGSRSLSSIANYWKLLWRSRFTMNPCRCNSTPATITLDWLFGAFAKLHVIASLTVAVT